MGLWIVGFGGPQGTCSVPESLNLATLVNVTRLLELHTKAREEFRHGHGGGKVRGLIEYRVGVALAADRSSLGLTEVRQGRVNHGGREVDGMRTIHSHLWDVAQSIVDVRNLIRANDVVGG